MKAKTWKQLTAAEQVEIINSFKEWKLDKLKLAKWTKERNGYWCADFGTKIKF